MSCDEDAIRLDACCNECLPRGFNAGSSLHKDLTQGCRCAAVLLICATGKLQLATGVHRAIVAQRLPRLHDHITAGLQGSAVAQPAFMVEGECPGVGLHRPGIAHPHASLGAQKMDLACVHAAELGHIKRIAWRSSRTINSAGLWCAVWPETTGLYLVGTGDHLQLLRPNACIDLECSAQDGGIRHASGVQALSVNLDGSALDAIAVQ